MELHLLFLRLPKEERLLLYARLHLRLDSTFPNMYVVFSPP